MTDDSYSYADDQELVDQFIGWTSGAVGEMREITDALEEQIANTSEQSDRLYDLAHNIKGMGSSFNFALMTSVGQSLCAYIKKSEAMISRRAIEAHVRIFEVVLEHKITGDGGDKGAALMDRLNGIILEEKK